MRSPPATTAVPAGAAALLPGLPDEIVVWEILVRLPPKPLLRCRAVSRAWRRATSARDFLLAHHGRQPSLPIVCGFENARGCYRRVTAYDRRAAGGAQLQPVARLDPVRFFCLEASCDGLLVLSTTTTTSRRCFSVCNPATRQRAFLRQPRDACPFILLGMYPHRPSGEYRLLLYRKSSRVPAGEHLLPEPKIGCYVSAFGSDQPPRYVGGPEAASELGFEPRVLVQDCLHWCPQQQHEGKSRLVIVVFDTTAESFRQKRGPILPTGSFIFEIDGKLVIYRYRYDDAMKVVDIWVLPNYEGEVWECMYRVELPVAEIRGHFGRREDQWDVTVASTTDGAVLLQLINGHWLFYIDVDGQLVHSFCRDGQMLSTSAGHRLKQTLVPHTFFTALEDHAVNALPFV